MALSKRSEKLADRILEGEFDPLVWIENAEKVHASTVDWRKEARKTGIKTRTAEQIVYAAIRGLEDEEEVRLYFLNERNTGEKDDWIVLVAVQDVDGTIFVGVTPGTIVETKSTMGLARHLREMVESTRPAGRPFGPRQFLN